MTNSSDHGRRGSRILPAAILSLGIFLAAVAFGLFFHAARERADTVQVVGSASERFHSDVAKWRIVLARRVPGSELSAGYAAIRADLDRLTEHVVAAGIDASAVAVQPVNAQPIWGPEGRQNGYDLVQSIYVVWPEPERLETLALNPGALLEDGAVLQSSQLEYYYTQIAEMKRSLLARATEDARRRAAEIAGAAGNGDGALARMRAARAGVFQITEPFSTDVAAYGIHSTNTREKEISVTVHATFEVE